MLFLQGSYGISDEELEYQVADRISFQRFLGFPNTIPDYSTVWYFREELSKDEKLNFKLLGSYEHKASGIEGLIPKNEVSYFKDSNKLNTETNIIKLKGLVSDLEKQAGKCLFFVKCVYFSEKAGKYLSLSFYYNNHFLVTFNSVYTYLENDQDKIIHPKNKQELYGLNRKIIQKSEITNILIEVWLKSVNNMYHNFENLSE